jgi:hypothetical protein
MPDPTPAQKAAVWLCVTMNNRAHLALLEGDTTSTDYQSAITDWDLSPEAVVFVRDIWGKAKRSNSSYTDSVFNVANGFEATLAVAGWGGPTCPKETITQALKNA